MYRRMCVHTYKHLLRKEATGDFSLAEKIRAWADLENTRYQCLQLSADLSFCQVTLD